MNNGGPGVLVGPDARNVTIRGNRINTNLGVGIDLVPAGGPPNGDGSTPNDGGAAGGNDLVFLRPGERRAFRRRDGRGGLADRARGEPTASSSWTSTRCPRVRHRRLRRGRRPIGSIALPASGPPHPFAAMAWMVSVGSFVTATATTGSGRVTRRSSRVRPGGRAPAPRPPTCP